MAAIITSALASVITSVVPLAIAGATGTPWRPPQWSGTPNSPALTITATSTTSGQQTAYVFDAVITGEHDQQVVITLNPVQTGAAITDNAYVTPPGFTAEIEMSDAMQSYTVGQFSGAPSRSVSAYQTLIALQAALTPMQVATRLRQYSNMMITDVRAQEDPKTKYALRAFVTFRQILTASAQVTATSTSSGQGTSANQQATGQTNTGPVNTTPVTPAISAQNNIGNTVVP
jgi:hypothetical protein